MRPGAIAASATVMASVAFEKTAAIASTPGPDLFTRSLDRGPVYAGATAFFGGLLVCLTPCVYPMIAVTVAVFGAHQTRSRLQAIGLSTAFVLGIVAMFTPLGVLAGMTGSLFGSALSNPWLVGGVALVFAALAASMLGAFEMVLPSSLTNRLAQVGGIGYFGAFLLGLVSGLVAAPCTGPVLTGILLWISRARNAWLGGTAMFAFSLGLGLPYWLVGTFAIRLPKGGAWMVHVKTFFGIVLATAALYFLRTVSPLFGRLALPSAGFAVGAACLFFAGFLVASAVVARLSPGTILAATTRALGVLASVAGLVLLVAWWELPSAGVEWRSFDAAAVARARAEGRPVLIDFTAEWCGACKELTKHTFSDRAVVAESQRFERLQVDATQDDDPRAQEAQRRYEVKGLPTVLLIDSTGEERVRLTEFVPPDPFRRSMETVR